MEVKEAILQRYSVRNYLEKPVPEDLLLEILDLARMAPSARNSQLWKIIVVREKKLREELMVASFNQSFIAQAPVVLAGVSLKPEWIMTCEVPAYAVDLAIVFDHITLMATSLGLGTCWIGAFSQPKVKKILDIPEEYKVMGLLPLGYPAFQVLKKKRKELEDLITYEGF